MEDILFKDGDWTITEIKKPIWNYHTVMKHVCYPNYNNRSVSMSMIYEVVVYPDSDYYCWRCSAPIPEGLVAIWKFQNWENLKYGN